jgi:hypothetical protein
MKERGNGRERGEGKKSGKRRKRREKISKLKNLSNLIPDNASLIKRTLFENINFNKREGKWWGKRGRVKEGKS